VSYILKRREYCGISSKEIELIIQLPPGRTRVRLWGDLILHQKLHVPASLTSATSDGGGGGTLSAKMERVRMAPSYFSSLHGEVE
jgi:hypothetical protein